MKRILAILATAIGFVMLAPPVGAEPPTQVTIPIPEDFVRDDLCAFPVEFHYLQWRRMATTHENGTGTLTTIENGVAKVRLTNLDSGESLDLNISGPGKLRVFPDGSFVFNGSGPWLFSDVPPGLGLPPLFWSSGRFQVNADTQGNLVSFEPPRRLVDLCPALA